MDQPDGAARARGRPALLAGLAVLLLSVASCATAGADVRTGSADGRPASPPGQPALRVADVSYDQRGALVVSVGLSAAPAASERLLVAVALGDEWGEPVVPGPAVCGGQQITATFDLAAGQLAFGRRSPLKVPFVRSEDGTSLRASVTDARLAGDHPICMSVTLRTEAGEPLSALRDTLLDGFAFADGDFANRGWTRLAQLAISVQQVTAARPIDAWTLRVRGSCAPQRSSPRVRCHASTPIPEARGELTLRMRGELTFRGVTDRNDFQTRVTPAITYSLRWERCPRGFDVRPGPCRIDVAWRRDGDELHALYAAAARRARRTGAPARPSAAVSAALGSDTGTARRAGR